MHLGFNDERLQVKRSCRRKGVSLNFFERNWTKLAWQVGLRIEAAWEAWEVVVGAMVVTCCVGFRGSFARGEIDGAENVIEAKRSPRREFESEEGQTI